jgi:hypothetical protein
MIPLGSGTLAEAMLPPPFNGGSDAGDVIFNSSMSWQINSSYDLETVAIHEIGHALGMGHSQITTADMYAYYNATKQSLTTDDSSGIQSIYGTRQYDAFNSNGNSNASYLHAANITSYLDANDQIAIPSLDMTRCGQTEWFLVTVPSDTSGTMVATMQSSTLSSLSPKIAVYTTSLSLVGTAGSSNFGDTVTVTVSGVQPGQSYYIKTCGNTGGSNVGGYGLEVNLGSQSQPPIPPPDTVVLQQPDQGGGSINSNVSIVIIGNYVGFGEALTASPSMAAKVRHERHDHGGSPTQTTMHKRFDFHQAISPKAKSVAASSTLAHRFGPLRHDSGGLGRNVQLAGKGHHPGG